MPYVLLIDGRYITEHSCGLYHYGRQDVYRECCVQDALKHLLDTAEGPKQDRGGRRQHHEVS